jgi:hypothetical protein
VKVRASDQKWQSGALTPTIRWLLYAGNKVAPLRRQFSGAMTPKVKWLLCAGNSHLLIIVISSLDNCASKILDIGYLAQAASNIRALLLLDTMSVQPMLPSTFESVLPFAIGFE